MNFEFVTEQSQLDELVSAMGSAAWIAFDTEFVSEFTYVPDLCLIQVALPEGLWVVDTIELPEVTSFWETLCEGEHSTVVHAGREEILFCHRAIDRTPKHWFDAQLAGRNDWAGVSRVVRKDHSEAVERARGQGRDTN